MIEDVLELTDEELVAQARSGDDRAIETLLNRYRHYARAKARTYFLAGADREDIIQEGMIGLFKAIRDFQAKRGTAFRAFAELCMTRQIITAIKTATRRKHHPLNSYVSLNRPAGEDDDPERMVGDELAESSIADPAELIVSAEQIERIKMSVEKLLSQFEGEVLQRYMEGQSYQQIAESLGRHAKSIDNALQRIKRKLEPHLAAPPHHSTARAF